MTHEGPSMHASIAAQAWWVARRTACVDGALLQSLHHQVTLALDRIRHEHAGRGGGDAARRRLDACIASLGGHAAIAALAVPWIAEDAGAHPGTHGIVPLSEDELASIEQVLGALDEPAGWTGPEDADGIEAGMGWHLRRVTEPGLRDGIGESFAASARVAFDRHRAAGRIGACWQLAGELNAFGGARCAALAADLVRWLEAVDAIDAHTLSRMMLDEWRTANGLQDDRAAWSWAGGVAGGEDGLADAIELHRERDRSAAIHAALRALLANPLVTEAEVADAITTHGAVVDGAIDAAVEVRAGLQRRARRGRVAWAALKVAACVLVVGLVAAWFIREGELDAQAGALAKEVDAAVDAGFDREEFGDALALIDAAAGRGLAARAPMLAAAARLRERMDARRVIEEESRAALAAVGPPTAPDAPLDTVRAMLHGPVSTSFRERVEAWIDEASRAATEREQARRAALAERAASIEAVVASAEAALESGGDARSPASAARASVDALAGDASLPGDRITIAQALGSRIDALVVRIEEQELRVRERARRSEELERTASLVGDPAAFAAALRAFAKARPDDPFASGFNEAAQLEPAWRTAIAWHAIAGDIARDPLPESLATARSQRERIEAWLREHASGPGVDAARRYLSLLPKEHDWAPGVAARVRGLRLDDLALIVLRDGTRQWHRRPATPVVERGGRVTVEAIDSVNQPKPAERVIDVAEIVGDSSRPLSAILAPLERRLATDADHGADAALSLMHDLVACRVPAAEPPIDPALRLYLCKAVALRAQQSLPALDSFLKPTIDAIDREGLDRTDWMVPAPRPETATAWIRAEALVASIAKLDLPGQWRAARAKSASLLANTPQPVAMLCWDAPGGVITPSPQPTRAGWSVLLPRGRGTSAMEPVGTINQDGRVELIRPDRIKGTPSGSVLFAVAPTG